mmetsp:Transcript_23242/g.55076  ORF Transcript_23242/g.55076 Transcript_23242/m.55076 type:complete len:459 (+) Transcript_23242:487-1863(+)
MAPSPSTAVMRYLPSCAGCLLSAMPGRSGIEKFHRLNHAGAHARERVGQRGDLVAAAGLELRRVQLALADAVGQRRQLGDRAHHQQPDHQVEHDADRDEHAHQRRDEDLEGLVGPLQRHAQRHRDDLRADHLVEVPAEAVGRAVLGHHRRGRGLDAAVAGQAGGVGDAQRPGDVERGAGGGVAGARGFLQLGIAAELADDVHLPAGGAVARVGGVQRRLLVGELGMLGQQRAQHLVGRKAGHGFRQELVGHLRGQQRLDLGVGVAAHRQRLLHQHLRRGDGFLFRVVLQQLAGDVAAQADAECHDEHIDEIELDEQFHWARLPEQAAYRSARSGAGRPRSVRGVAERRLERCDEARRAGQRQRQRAPAASLGRALQLVVPIEAVLDRPLAVREGAPTPAEHRVGFGQHLGMLSGGRRGHGVQRDDAVGAFAPVKVQIAQHGRKPSARCADRLAAPNPG